MNDSELNDEKAIRLMQNFGCARTEIRELMSEIEQVNSDEEMDQIRARLTRLDEWTGHPFEDYYDD